MQSNLIVNMGKPPGILTDIKTCHITLYIYNSFTFSQFSLASVAMLLILFLIMLASCLTYLFTEAEVFASLTSLNPNKAPRPDSLHSQALKNCAGSLAKPLLLLFTQSINTSMLPSDWRRAHLSPILKRVQKLTQQITDL